MWGHRATSEPSMGMELNWATLAPDTTDRPGQRGVAPRPAPAGPLPARATRRPPGRQRARQVQVALVDEGRPSGCSTGRWTRSGSRAVTCQLIQIAWRSSSASRPVVAETRRRRRAAPDRAPGHRGPPPVVESATAWPSASRSGIQGQLPGSLALRGDAGRAEGAGAGPRQQVDLVVRPGEVPLGIIPAQQVGQVDPAQSASPDPSQPTEGRIVAQGTPDVDARAGHQLQRQTLRRAEPAETAGLLGLARGAGRHHGRHHSPSPTSATVQTPVRSQYSV